MSTTMLALAILAAPQIFEAGPLTLEVSTARTAQIFHVLDQLAAWNPFSHTQYRKAIGELPEEEEALLLEYRKLRQARGYGVLDQVFYTELDAEAAAKNAAGRLTAEERATILRVFRKLGPRIETLLAEHRKLLDGALGELAARTAELTELSLAASRFAGGARVRVPVYLIASPDGGGGGFNGGVLTLEVSKNRALFPLIVHESWHAFINTDREAILETVRSTPGLDETTLGEGLAYALMPGLITIDEPLEERVKKDTRNGGSFSDPYVRFRRFGLALRPLLLAALEDEKTTLRDFLPRARDVYLAVRESAIPLEPRAPALFIFGPVPKTRLAPIAAAGHDVWSRKLVAGDMKEVLQNARPGDGVVFALTPAELAAGVPAEFQDLLPRSFRGISAEKPRELSGRARAMTVLVFVAPEVAALNTLLDSSAELNAWSVSTKR